MRVSFGLLGWAPDYKPNFHGVGKKKEMRNVKKPKLCHPKG
jgi:hypothetical protein